MKIIKKYLTILYCFAIITSRWNAVIAQMVERILGKDEVSSSNLDSSSKKSRVQSALGIFFFSYNDI